MYENFPKTISDMGLNIIIHNFLQRYYICYGRCEMLTRLSGYYSRKEDSDNPVTDIFEEGTNDQSLVIRNILSQNHLVIYLF